MLLLYWSQPANYVVPIKDWIESPRRAGGKILSRMMDVLDNLSFLVQPLYALNRIPLALCGRPA